MFVCSICDTLWIPGPPEVSARRLFHLPGKQSNVCRWYSESPEWAAGSCHSPEPTAGFSPAAVVSVEPVIDVRMKRNATWEIQWIRLRFPPWHNALKAKLVPSASARPSACCNLPLFCVWARREPCRPWGSGLIRGSGCDYIRDGLLSWRLLTGRNKKALWYLIAIYT